MQSRVVAMLRAVTAIAISIAATAAAAHSFYDVECCGGEDCAPAAPGEVKPVPGGWVVTHSGEFISNRQTRPSPDGRVHRCYPRYDEMDLPDPPTRCLYVPQSPSS